MPFKFPRKRSIHYERFIFAVIIFVAVIILVSQLFMHHAIIQQAENEGHERLRTKKYYIHHNRGNRKENAETIKYHDSPPVIRNNETFVPTLRGKKIFIEITTVGLTQYAYFEMVLDSIRNICEAGAHISVHVTTTNCNPKPGPDDEECPLYGQYVEDTLEDNYSVEKISQLNERLRCRNPEGSISTDVHLVSPYWGKEVVNHHRRLFYDNIDKGYDLFIHTEEDEEISPTNVIAFMDELEKLRRLVGDEVSTDILFISSIVEINNFSSRRITFCVEITGLFHWIHSIRK